MTAADHAKRICRYETTALGMHVAMRVQLAMGNFPAAALAKENRDVARRMRLEALADELLANPWGPS